MDMWVKQCDKGIVSCFEAKVNFNDGDDDGDDDNDGDDCMQHFSSSQSWPPNPPTNDDYDGHNPNQGDYDNQLPTFRGCAGTAFPHDEKCAYEKQVKKEKKKWKTGKKKWETGLCLSLNLLLVSTTFNAVFSQAVSIVEGKKSVDVGVSLCYCNSDLCNQVRCDNNNALCVLCSVGYSVLKNWNHKNRLFIKLCHWFLKVPFFSLDDRKVRVERFYFYLK